MRVSKMFLFLALCVPTLVFGQISGISPQSIFLGPQEDFLTIRGENLLGNESTLITFTGPAGQFTLEPSAAAENGSSLIVFIPELVAITEGQHAIDVYVKDVNFDVRHYGPVTLSVVQQVIEAPPLLFVPEVVTAPALNTRGTAVTYEVSAMSQGGTGLTFSCTPASGSLFAMGSTPVSCTASDSFGTTNAAFAVVVSDLTPPVFTSAQLPNITTANPVVTFPTPTAEDAIDGANVTVHCFPASGSTFPFGETLVECRAEDQSFNPAGMYFTVFVTGGPPEITVPADITAEATSAAGAVVTFTVTATESGTVSCSPASGSTFALGTTTVNCTATNDSGSDSGSFTVTVVDTTAPVVTVTASPASLWPPNHKMVLVTLNVVASDAVDPNPVTTIVAVTSNQPVNGTGDGDEAPDWIITGPKTVQLRAERAGNDDRIYTIMVQTTDSSGNGVITQVQVKVTQQNNGKGRAAG